MNRRREFIAGLVGAAVAWPGVSDAQQRLRTARLGILMSLNEADPSVKGRMKRFRDELH